MFSERCQYHLGVKLHHCYLGVDRHSDTCSLWHTRIPFPRKHDCQFTWFGRYSVLICIDTGKPQASTLIDCLIATDQETNRLIAAAELKIV